MLYLQCQMGTGPLHGAAGGAAPPGSCLQHFVSQAHGPEQSLVFLAIKPVVSACAVLQRKVSTEVDAAN